MNDKNSIDTFNSKDDFGGFDNFNDDNYSFRDWKPQDMSFDTFKLRNDPENVLKKIKYYLMQVEEGLDKDNKVTIRSKKNIINVEFVKSLVIHMCVEEIMLVLDPIINNHNVMGNISDDSSHKALMFNISMDLTVYFWGKQEDWKLDRNHVNALIQFISHEISIFLSRTIGDAERMHYGESFKETREVKPVVSEKKNFLSNFMGGFRGK